MVTTAIRREASPLPSSEHLDRLVARGDVLQGGDGPAVREAQQLLVAHGFEPGPVDGEMGPRTRSAVMAFQRSRGVGADGIIGPATLRELRTPTAGVDARRGVDRGITAAPSDRIPGQTGADFQRAAELEAARRQRAQGPSPADTQGARPGEVTLAPHTLSEREKFDHYAAIVRAHGGEVNPGGKPTVLGLRGLDIQGNSRVSTNSSVYDDTFVVLTADKRVLELKGATHAGQIKSSLVEHVGRINPGHYTAAPNGNHNGMPSFHVKTLDGSGSIPGVRDRNDDGHYSTDEIQRSAQRGDALTEILFHVGLGDRPSSIGCQTLPPDAMRKLIERVGGRGFSFSLVDAH